MIKISAMNGGQLRRSASLFAVLKSALRARFAPGQKIRVKTNSFSEFLRGTLIKTKIDST